MRRKRTIIFDNTPATLADYIVTASFWGLVFGWPVFVLIYRWLH